MLSAIVVASWVAAWAEKANDIRLYPLASDVHSTSGMSTQPAPVAPVTPTAPTCCGNCGFTAEETGGRRCCPKCPWELPSAELATKLAKAIAASICTR